MAQGLEALATDSRGRVSRALHDEVGPYLCSAGLMLGLLRSAWNDLPKETRDMLDAIQDALEGCVDTVRLLSYHNDPALADRCGLRGAIDSLTRERKVRVRFPTAPPEFSPAESRFLVRLVHDVSLAWPAPHDLEVTSEGLLLTAPPGCELERSRLAALTHLGREAGFLVQCRESQSGILISVLRGREA